MTIKEWQREVHQGARDRGWYDGELGEKTPLRITSLLCLIHSEVSEALEELRAGKMATQEQFYDSYGYHGPTGFPSELADTMIRLMDLAEWLGIDLEEQIRIKNEYNKTRGKRHGGKAL